ncbi:MAG: hypothetical protein IIB60_03795 [Planctomycetes bacterium]|nr:hypothetical protein [Planctomycetota bacterium]
MFDHGPSFGGKPARADIPNLCGDCHADIERMNPYGLRTDQLARYWTSGHGKTLAKNRDDRVAVCVDCHGVHDVYSAREPASKTHPLNVPDTCGVCHGDAALMGEFGLPTAQIDEYRRSVHGQLLLEQHDTGAPTCATCHGSHSSAPPGFASVGAVCGKCHQRAAEDFSTSVHAGLEAHKGCVHCHGGGEGAHSHLIEQITTPADVLIRRFGRALASEPKATPEQITDALHPDPKRIMTHALATCLECHDEIDEDETLPKLFELLDVIAGARREYARTGYRLDEVGHGILLVDRQRFTFEDAKTHLVALSALQHTLDSRKLAEKAADLEAVCAQVNSELDELEQGLHLRRIALIPIWIFALVFSALLYAKYKQLKARYVVPLPDKSSGGTA